MKYIISDIHGCYEQYQTLLEKIHFSDEDMLYVLGDAVDRGPEPMKVLQDMMSRPNLVFIMGNHDFAFYYLMKKMMLEVTEENCDELIKSDILRDYSLWLSDGGEVTAEQFGKLNKEEKEDILDFLADAEVYEIVEHGNNRYVLVHAGIDNFSEDKDFDEYDLADFIEGRTDYKKRYFQDEHTFLVTGHTPTKAIHKEFSVYQGNGHIAIDCGCVFGGRLAAYCIETGEVVYSDSEL